MLLSLVLCYLAMAAWGLFICITHVFPSTEKIRSSSASTVFVYMRVVPFWWAPRVNWDDESLFTDHDIYHLLADNPSMIKFCTSRYITMNDRLKRQLNDWHPGAFVQADLLGL